MSGETLVGYMALDVMRDFYLQHTKAIYELGEVPSLSDRIHINKLDMLLKPCEVSRSYEK